MFDKRTLLKFSHLKYNVCFPFSHLYNDELGNKGVSWMYGFMRSCASFISSKLTSRSTSALVMLFFFVIETRNLTHLNMASDLYIRPMFLRGEGELKHKLYIACEIGNVKDARRFIE